MRVRGRATLLVGVARIGSLSTSRKGMGIASSNHLVGPLESPRCIADRSLLRVLELSGTSLDQRSPISPFPSSSVIPLEEGSGEEKSRFMFLLSMLDVV